MLLWIPGGFQFLRLNSFWIAFDRISETRVDFPLPDTPVTEINFPNGNSAVKFFRLFSFAPRTTIFSLLPFLLFLGYGTICFPDKY